MSVRLFSVNHHTEELRRQGCNICFQFYKFYVGNGMLELKKSHNLRQI